MKRTAIAFSVSLMAALPAAALAQTEHDSHHPAQAPAVIGQAPVSPQPKPGMSGMPEQGQAMMQAMSPECMKAMQQMMQGGMMQGMMVLPNPAGAASAGFSTSRCRASWSPK